MTDDLEARIARMKAERAIDKTHAERQRSRDARAGLGDDLTATARFTREVVSGALWLWETIGLPVSKAVWRGPVKAFGLWYAWLWRSVTYKKNKFGDDVFSRRWAGSFIVASLLLLWQSITIFWFMVCLITFVFLPLEGTVIYMKNSQERAEDYHVISGCFAVVPCNEEDTEFYVAEASLFNHFWSFLNNGWFFMPDRVGSVVSPGWNECVINVGYGTRAKPLIKNNVYPAILSLSCKPYDITKAGEL